MVKRRSKPSAHLSWKELACKDGTPYPDEWRAMRLPQLVDVFEQIRQACGGQPIQILSAFRTHEHNRGIGGARRSQHIQGRALDLRPPKGWSVGRFYKVIRDLQIVSGLGRYRTFVHVDVRYSDRLVAWTGAGVKDDTGRMA